MRDLERFEARKKIVEDLKAQGLLEKVTDHAHAIGICERSKTIVEPRISTQWFCRMKELAAPALQAVREWEPGKENTIQIVPDNRRQEFLNWLDNIRDWTISRQLWWGHRIPAWYCGDCEHIIVAEDAPREMHEMRIGKADAGSGRAGYLVQLGALAVFDAGLAGEDGGF